MGRLKLGFEYLELKIRNPELSYFYLWQMIHGTRAISVPLVVSIRWVERDG